MSSPIAAAIAVVVWGLAIATPSSRNLRFLTAAIAWSVLWLGSLVLPSEVRLAGQVGLLLAAAFAMLSPASVGLASLTRREAHADKLLLDAWRDYQDAPASGTALANLDLRPYRQLHGNWLAAARLLRWSARSAAGFTFSNWHVPAEQLQRAGRAYWHDAQCGRVLGARHLVTTWHEQILLRCYYECFDDLIPARRLPPAPTAEATAAAGALIAEIRRLKLNDLVSLETRDILASTLAGRLTSSDGSSASALADQRAAARALRNAWVHLAERSRELGDSLPPVA